MQARSAISGPDTSWFWRPPRYDDETRTRRARLLHGFAFGLFSIVTISIGLIVLLQPEIRTFALWSLLRAGAIFLTVLVLNRHGQQSAAAILLIVGPLVLITANALMAGGVRSPGVQFFFVLALVASLVLGERVGMITGVVCVGINFGLALAESLGVLPQPVVRFGVWVLWALNAMYVAYFLVALRMSVRTLSDALIRCESELTQRRRAEEALERHRRDLEHLITQRTEELRIARDAAEDANRAKTRFLAHMSHEIRTPMNAVLGYTQLLRKDAALGVEQRQQVDAIELAGDHLMSLLEGVLQIAKIESGRIDVHPTRFDLWLLVADVQRLLRARVAEKGLTLGIERTGAPRHVLADEGKIRQILINLLDNAIKFTSAGGISVRLAARSDDGVPTLAIEVEDTGAGIADDELERVFERFEQTMTGRASGRGSGLGLTISKELARAMGGDLHVRSRPGQGTAFTLAIPYGEPAPLLSKPVQEEADEPALTASALGAVPLALRRALRDATLQADIERIRSLLADAEPYAPSTVSAARAYADRFAYERILEALEPTLGPP